MSDTLHASDRFDRGLAIQCISSHKNESSFQLHESTPTATIDELKRLGCTIAFDKLSRKYTVSAQRAFSDIANKYHKNEDRKLILQSCGLRILYYGGIAALPIIAMLLDMGYATAGLWLLCWGFIVEGTFPYSHRINKKVYLTIGLILFALGFVTYLLGWE